MASEQFWISQDEKHLDVFPSYLFVSVLTQQIKLDTIQKHIQGYQTLQKPIKPSNLQHLKAMAERGNPNIKK